MEERKVRRCVPHEPSAIQYGAWDNPGISIFAAISQDPMPNMLTSMKQLPRGTSDCDNDACPMIMEASQPTSAVYHMVKYQVEEMVNKRNLDNHPLERQKRDNNLISQALGVEKKQELVDASVRKQLHLNVPQLRDLVVEIERANTALNVKRHMEQEQRSRADEKTRWHSEAIADQVRTQKEIQAEKEQQRQKSAIFGTQLMAQISEDRSRREKQQLAILEEGRRARYESEKLYALEKNQEIERRYNYRRLLKSSMDEFADVQRNHQKSDIPAPTDCKPENGVLDALGPQTADLIAKSMKARKEKIATRDLISARLGHQLSQIKHEKEARENLITGLLVREHKAKESDRARQQAETSLKKKAQIREELLNQRIEQQFYRDKLKAFNKLIPYDDTCFGERQHQEDVARNEAMHRLQVASYADMSKMIIENGRRRAQEIVEHRKMCRAINDMQIKQDDMVRQERLRLLSCEPKEVLHALRLSSLTNEEVQKFNLKKSSKE